MENIQNYKFKLKRNPLWFISPIICFIWLITFSIKLVGALEKGIHSQIVFYIIITSIISICLIIYIISMIKGKDKYTYLEMSISEETLTIGKKVIMIKDITKIYIPRYDDIIVINLASRKPIKINTILLENPAEVKTILQNLNLK